MIWILGNSILVWICNWIRVSGTENVHYAFSDSVTSEYPPLALSLSPPLLHLPPAPPDQVDSTTVSSENLSLRRTRLTWAAPEDNNARITNYWITYCIPLMDFNDTCRNQVPVPSFSMNSIENLTDINPDRRYRVTIQARNAAGRGPESQPYFFNSASAGRCCYIHM